MKQKILIADDEESIRFTFSSFLCDAGYYVETADTLSECIKKLQKEQFNLLFLDIGIGRDNGIDAIKGIKILQPNCEIVIITGKLNPPAICKARHYGALDYVVKPVYEASLKYIAQKALAN